MIENRQFRLSKFDVIGSESVAEIVERWIGKEALRWYIAQVTEKEIVVEATFADGEPEEPFETLADRPRYPGKAVAVSVIPTGIGCDLGGYAGDAAPATNLLAAAVDYLVTNPNAVNASNFISMADNVLYCEGMSIDLLMKGAVDFHVPYANRIGLIVEDADPAALDVVFNVVNTVRSVFGIDVVDVVVTERPIGTHSFENGSGAFVGTVDRPDVLFSACERLVRQGANAIAITTNIQDLPEENYVKHFAGEYPNPLGGVEAILSHLVVRRFHIPAAHAPMLNCKHLELLEDIVDARGAGEMASVSGLACTLIGLRRAPQISSTAAFRGADAVNLHNVLAVVCPASALGGIPAIYAHRYGVPIIAVRENRTILSVSAARLGFSNVIEVDNYAEAAGILLALRKGIGLESFRRPLKTLRHGLGVAVEETFRARLA
ncbi:MAG TPA: DUF3326 domain-containing protein [Thermoanaerobaculia bacterium]|nr:DUF3326 domain-containing protein [Thermoanaerobaculia bacterium]